MSEYEKFYKFLEGKPVREITDCLHHIADILGTQSSKLQHKLDTVMKAVADQGGKPSASHAEKQRVKAIMSDIMTSGIQIPHGMNGFNKKTKKFVRFLPGHHNRPVSTTVADDLGLKPNWFIDNDLKIYLNWCPDGYYEMSRKDSRRFNGNYSPNRHMFADDDQEPTTPGPADLPEKRKAEENIAETGGTVTKKRKSRFGNFFSDSDESVKDENKDATSPVRKLSISTAVSPATSRDVLSTPLASATSGSAPATPSVPARKSEQEVDEEVRRELKDLNNTGAATTSTAAPFVSLPIKGDTVRISEGVFKGSQGTIVGTLSSNAQVYRVEVASADGVGSKIVKVPITGLELSGPRVPAQSSAEAEGYLQKLHALVKPAAALSASKGPRDRGNQGRATQENARSDDDDALEDFFRNLSKTDDARQKDQPAEHRKHRDKEPPPRLPPRSPPQPTPLASVSAGSGILSSPEKDPARWLSPEAVLQTDEQANSPGEEMQVEETAEAPTGSVAAADVTASAVLSVSAADIPHNPSYSASTDSDSDGYHTPTRCLSSNACAEGTGGAKPASAPVPRLQPPSTVRIEDRVRVLKGEYKGLIAVVTDQARVRDKPIPDVFVVHMQNALRSKVSVPAEFLQLVESAALDAEAGVEGSLTPRQEGTAPLVSDRQGGAAGDVAQSGEGVDRGPFRAVNGVPTTAALHQDTLRFSDGAAQQLQTRLVKSPQTEQLAARAVHSKPGFDGTAPSILHARKDSSQGFSQSSSDPAGSPLGATSRTSLSPKGNGQHSSKFASITDLPHLPPPATAQEAPAPAQGDDAEFSEPAEESGSDGPPTEEVAAQGRGEIWDMDVSPAELENASRWN
jgi:ribosomal protein L24